MLAAGAKTTLAGEGLPQPSEGTQDSQAGGSQSSASVKMPIWEALSLPWPPSERTLTACSERSCEAVWSHSKWYAFTPMSDLGHSNNDNAWLASPPNSFWILPARDSNETQVNTHRPNAMLVWVPLCNSRGQGQRETFYLVHLFTIQTFPKYGLRPHVRL